MMITEGINEKMEGKLTVGDLIERRPNGFGIKSSLAHGRIVAMSSKTGKRLFDTRQNKDAIIAKYYGCEVGAIWTDLKVTGNHDFGRSCAEPVIMLYVYETQEDKGDE